MLLILHELIKVVPYLLGLLFCAVVAGIILSNKIREKDYVIDGPYIRAAGVYQQEYVKQVLLDTDSGSSKDEIFERALDTRYVSNKLEQISDGTASKLFLNGRGSWRLTQGNIKTDEWLKNEGGKEYKEML